MRYCNHTQMLPHTWPTCLHTLMEPSQIIVCQIFTLAYHDGRDTRTQMISQKILCCFWVVERTNEKWKRKVNLIWESNDSTSAKLIHFVCSSCSQLSRWPNIIEQRERSKTDTGAMYQVVSIFLFRHNNIIICIDSYCEHSREPLQSVCCC